MAKGRRAWNGKGRAAARASALAIILAMGLAMGLAMAPAARACGSVGMWIDIYGQGERHKALFHMLDCASSYKPLRDDAALLPVVADALGRDPEVAELGLSVFNFYNCLYGARNKPGYAELLAKVKAMDSGIDLARYRDWLVVTAPRGANLRQAPEAQAPVVTALPLGLQVRRLGGQGDWVKVRPVGPGSVDPRFERSAGWVHASLLAPY